MNDSADAADLTCPACGRGTLKDRVETEIVEQRGITGELKLRYAVCDHCGAEITGADDARENKRAMNDFKNSVGGSEIEKPEGSQSECP